jgi:hypothetical protein
MVTARAPALRPTRVAIVPERLESCIRRLEPADRAVLDLSLNRGIPDAAMAPLLRTDPMRLAWKRARAIERVASRLGLTHPADLVLVRAALLDLPSRAWLPLELQPPKVPPVLEPPEPEGVEPIVRRTAFPQTAQTIARRGTSLDSTYGAGPRSTAAPTRRAAASSLGGLSERAKRAYPRGTMQTRAARAAGALLVGAAALAFRKRR